MRGRKRQTKGGHDDRGAQEDGVCGGDHGPRLLAHKWRGRAGAPFVQATIRSSLRAPLTAGGYCAALLETRALIVHRHVS
jgi:hypothetical protein